jgi:phosphoglycerol transferase MdoB-like AlkP superfamily enzyme
MITETIGSIRIQIAYLLFWMGYFTFDRIFSLLYHFSKTRTLSVADLVGLFWNGWRMDASISAYISIIPFFLLLLHLMLRGKRWLIYILSAYTILVVIVCITLCIIDRGIFTHWGYRLDATPLQFIGTPREMIASLTPFELLAALFAGLLLSYFWIKLFKKRILNQLKKREISSVKTSHIVLHFVWLALLFISCRGGLQLLPMNSSLVYFSDNQYANQSAINPVWNFSYALAHAEGYKKQNPYQYFLPDELNQLVQPMMPQAFQSADTSILNTARPNVIILIWESLTAKIFEPLGGDKNVTPHLAAIAAEGLLFSNIYANGNRSDKGLPALGSAYPAQPAQSIAMLMSKMLKLPHLSQPFAQNGYQTAFYYGGDLNFGNMYAYYNNGDYHHVVGKSSFKAKDMNKKWGASDGAVLEKFLTETPDDSAPFFKTLFTLSSHEPFDVPMKTKFEGTDLDNRFRNAHAYTDSCIGHFIAEARKKKWWSNTLVVIVADHGHPLPESRNDGYDMPSSFHIPMVFTGGALKKLGKCHTFGNQTDLAATLLHQLGWSSAQFPFSRDLFANKNPHFAHYVFKEGLGYLDKKSTVVFKHDMNSIRFQQNANDLTIKQAKAYLQKTYQDFIEK